VKKDCSGPYVREEGITDQIDSLIRGVAVPAAWTNWMNAELAVEQGHDAGEHERELAAAEDKRRQIDLKLDRLLAVHLDGNIFVDEYRSAKERILGEKQKLVEKIKGLTASREKQFEPVMRFVKSLQEATLLASGSDAIAKRDFLKKNGSNLTLSTRGIQWEPRGAWKIVEKHGPFAHHTSAPVCEGALGAGETRPMFFLAEEEGFEPP